MASTFKFELVTPERVLVSADVEQVVVPGSEGDFTVLPGHAPLISTLRPGVLDVTFGGQRQRILVKGGFAEVQPTDLAVLAEHAFDVKELSRARISEELSAAEASAASAKTDDDRANAASLIEELRRLEAA